MQAFNEKKSCFKCKNPIATYTIPNKELNICYTCLRNGKGIIPKNTELGIITQREIYRGATYAYHNINPKDYKLISLEDGDVGVKLPLAIMNELLRTPSYPTWQGKNWLFCCKKPMIFLGVWKHLDFQKHSPDGDMKKFMQNIIIDYHPSLSEVDHDGIYVFECKICNSKKANWDSL